MRRQDPVIRSSKITWEDLAKDKLTALVEDCSKHAEKQTSSLQIPYFNTKSATWNGEDEIIPSEIKLTISLLETEAVVSSLIPDPMEEQKQTLTTNLSK